MNETINKASLNFSDLVIYIQIREKYQKSRSSLISINIKLILTNTKLILSNLNNDSRGVEIR